MRKFSFGFWVYAFWTLTTVFWWGLAFAPAGATPPDWLVRTRNVCFGSVDNGLPDTYGWMTLILGPGSIVVGLFYIWGAEIIVDVRRLATRPAGIALLLVLFGGPLVGAHTVGSTITQAMRTSAALAAEPVAGILPDNYPRLDRPAPDFALVDQHGATVTPAGLRGKVTFVTFAYAHCATVCPFVIKTLTTAVAGFPHPHNAVVVTLDPWRDTQSSLPSLAEKWQLPAGAALLSGPPETVQAMLKAYNAGGARNENTGEISHPPLFYVLDAEGKIAYALNNPSAEELSEAASRALVAKVARR